MQPDRSLRILGSRVDPVSSDEARLKIAELLAQRRFAHVVTFGSEMAILAHRDPAYREVVNAADLVVPDTIGIVYAARLLGQPMRERVAGIELLERLCAACVRDSIGIFLLGGERGVAEQAGTQLQRRHPGLAIVGAQHGYFAEADERAIIERIRDSGARLVLVALGFPKQEVWIRKNASALGPVVCIGVGGSFDVIAGRLQRAPAALRKFGLEWLYRLIKEPRRLGRQLVLPQFALLVAGQVLRERFSPH